MKKRTWYIINGITIYRLLAAFILLYFIILDQVEIFRFFLLISFFTDAIDGFLARYYKVTSSIGSTIDSIADDLTILMAIIGVFVFVPAFVDEERTLIIILLALYLVQITIALIRYRRISVFHTYLAKIAAVFQGLFLILIFFLPEYPILLFQVAATLTILDLIEEIILVLLLPKWQTDIKGLFWIMKKRTHSHIHNY